MTTSVRITVSVAADDRFRDEDLHQPQQPRLMTAQTKYCNFTVLRLCRAECDWNGRGI